MKRAKISIAESTAVHQLRLRNDELYGCPEDSEPCETLVATRSLRDTGCRIEGCPGHNLTIAPSRRGRRGFLRLDGPHSEAVASASYAGSRYVPLRLLSVGVVTPAVKWLCGVLSSVGAAGD
jgi:hypothetical protein